MRHMRKLLALVLAVMLVMSLATSAFAAKITIDDATITGATYKAYKLLNATHNPGSTDTEEDDLFAYTINTKYAEVLKTVTGAEDDAGVVAYIEKVSDVNAFANEVYAAIVKANLAEDYVTTTNEFADVEQGYYLIVESALGTTESGATDTYSLLMLDTAGDDDITVQTKEDLPTVGKKVQEKNDSTGDSSWGTSADYDVGDEINYEITGTVSNKYAGYKSYYYSFSDTMTDGLSLKTESDPADYTDSIKVTVDGVDVTEEFTITATEHAFTATANLKELTGVTANANSQIVVTYTAVLNENAVSGATGNKNTVVLEYENDPKKVADGDPETPDKPDEPGKTPPVVNIVFTFDVIVDKVDKEGNALEGAGFTLYKWIDSGVEDDEATPNVDESGEWVAVGNQITGETTFEFKKLDEGKYKLEETTVPQGYNKADDIYFSIESTLGDDTLTNLVVKDVTGAEVSDFTVTVPSGKIETDVVNNAGIELPETGGIGTTIFYALGGILVLAAVVLLVTKKRMSV